ncbi:MAG: type IV secretion system DNA-binding domain-containing protein [Pseudomonadota bacterium]
MWEAVQPYALQIGTGAVVSLALGLLLMWLVPPSGIRNFGVRLTQLSLAALGGMYAWAHAREGHPKEEVGLLVGFLVLVVTFIGWRFIFKSPVVEGRTLSNIADTKVENAPVFNPISRKMRDHVLLLGRDKRKKPVTIERNAWEKRHTEIIGSTGVGKGQLLQTIGHQAIQWGNGLVVIDPKRDDYLPHVLAASCKRAGRRMRILDLRKPELSDGWHPFLGGDPQDRFERACIALNIQEREDSAEFFRTKAREYVSAAIRRSDDGGRIDRMLEYIENCGDEEHTAGIRSTLRGWLDLGDRLCPAGDGFDLDGALSAGEVVYVMGWPTDKQLARAFRAVLTAVMQWRKHHSGDQTGSHLTVLADEVHGYATMELADSVAMGRSSGVNFVLAHQSLSDLEIGDPKQGKAIQNRIYDNCHVKVVFGTKDRQMAERIAADTGTTQVWRPTANESIDGDRNVRAGAGQSMDVEPLIPANQIQMLGDRVAVLLAPARLASLFHIGVIPVANKAKPLSEYASVVPYEPPPAPPKPPPAPKRGNRGPTSRRRKRRRSTGTKPGSTSPDEL